MMPLSPRVASKIALNGDHKAAGRPEGVPQLQTEKSQRSFVDLTARSIQDAVQSPDGRATSGLTTGLGWRSTGFPDSQRHSHAAAIPTISVYFLCAQCGIS